jgi:hypothetical protein
MSKRKSPRPAKKATNQVIATKSEIEALADILHLRAGQIEDLEQHEDEEYCRDQYRNLALAENLLERLLDLRK